ncbi:hypothetical protein MTP99_001443 [Tenebrio molitor]|nr:hypothetical protein MTP99_001443 [Tenebrio molitor]
MKSILLLTFVLYKVLAQVNVTTITLPTTLSDTSTSEANSFIQTLRDINGTTNSTEISILSSKEISNTTTISSVPTSIETTTFNGTSTTKISSSIQTTSESGKFFSVIFVTSYRFSRKLILSVSCWQCYDTFRQFRNNHIVICSAFKNNNNTFESYSNRSNNFQWYLNYKNILLNSDYIRTCCWQCYATFRQFRNNHIVICSAFKNNNNTFESYSNRSNNFQWYLNYKNILLNSDYIRTCCWQCYDTFRQFRNNHIVICSAFKNNNNTFESYSNRSKNHNRALNRKRKYKFLNFFNNCNNNTNIYEQYTIFITNSNSLSNNSSNKSFKLNPIE